MSGNEGGQGFGPGPLLDALGQLDKTDATISHQGDTVAVHAPPHLLEWLRPVLVAERELLIAVAIGRAGTVGRVQRGKRIATTRHELVACDTCGEPSMVGITQDRIKNRAKWSRCRMTPHCKGRHVPTQAWLEGVA